MNFKDNNGIRVPKWFPTGYEVKGNKKKAQAVLNELVVKYDNANLADVTKKILFTDYIRQWLKSKKPQIDIITYEGYESFCDVHIIPYFEKLRLDIRDVTPRQIQDYYNEKYTNGKIRRYDKAKNNPGNMGLSVSTLRKHRIILNQVFEDAVFNQLLNYNPVTFAKLPKVQKHTQVQFYNNKQANDLLKVIDDYTFKTLIATTLYYGLRRSEVLGLRYSAIDFDNNKLFINHTVVKNKSTVRKDKTKSEASNTEFPLLPIIKNMFLELKKCRENNRLLFGSEYQESDYVFTWEDGRAYTPDYVSKHFKKILEQNDLPIITFHNLRHSTTSILLEKGWDIKSIQLWARHADVKTTLNIYTHIKENQKMQLADSLNDVFEV